MTEEKINIQTHKNQSKEFVEEVLKVLPSHANWYLPDPNVKPTKVKKI